MTTEHNHQDLSATDISAERLHMEIEREDYREPIRTKRLLEMFTEWPNGIPNGIPNHLTGGLPNDYQEANGYSTEAAYRDTHREVDREVYHEVDRQSLPCRPRFTETPALLESAFARRLSSGEKDQGEKITGNDHRTRYGKTNTSELPILYEACGSTVRGLERAQAHLNTW
jgi:hypothetical protein